MPNFAENALLACLSDADAVEQLAGYALAPECVPTPGLAAVFDWAVDQFMASGRRQAPSRAALAATWGDALEQMGADLEDEDVQVDTVASAVAHLKSQYARLQFQNVLRDAALSVSTATDPEVAGAVAAVTDKMAALAEMVRERPSGIDAATGIAASLDRLQYRIDHPGQTDAFGLGMPVVDLHTGGIRAGEVCTVIAPEKTGKSFTGLWATLAYFRAGGHPSLFTLENTPDDTFDRLNCLANGVDYDDFQRGKVSIADMARMREWLSDNAKGLAERVTVLSPHSTGRTAAAMCRAARLRGADALIIDQLSHMAVTGRSFGEREDLAACMRQLTAEVSQGTDPLKCLLLVQASRDSSKAAAKSGSLGVHAGGGTSEIERSSTFAFGLHRSEDDRACGEATLELLAARRCQSGVSWQLKWAPWKGMIHAFKAFDAH